MQGHVAALVFFASIALPGVAASEAVAENLAWLRSLVGDYAREDAVVYDSHGARAMTSAEALRLTAERSAWLSIPALVQDLAGQEARPYSLGKGAFFEYGLGTGCGPFQHTRILASTPRFPGSLLYSGSVTYGSMAGGDPSRYFRGWVLDFTSEGTTGGEYTSGYPHFFGNSDLYCLNFGFSLYLAYPSVDGYVEHVPEGALPGPLPDVVMDP